MSRENPADSIHDLYVCLLRGQKVIYVTSTYYMKKLKEPETRNYLTLLAETIQIAYAYGCEFIKVD